MNRRMIIFGLFVLAVSLSGCKSEPKIEEVPVQKIEPSEPPAYEAPVVQESRFGSDGVFKVAEKKYFGAVAPITVKEVSCNNDECHLIVPRMNSSDVERFLEKYFPYQEMTRFVKVNQFELYPRIKEEYRGDAIVPELDPNVFKPNEADAVFIRVYWSKRESEYVWLYRNPANRRSAVSPYDIPIAGDEMQNAENSVVLTEEESAKQAYKFKKQHVAALEKEIQGMESEYEQLRVDSPEKAEGLKAGMEKLKVALEHEKKEVEAERAKYE